MLEKIVAVGKNGEVVKKKKRDGTGRVVSSLKKSVKTENLNDFKVGKLVLELVSREITDELVKGKNGEYESHTEVEVVRDAEGEVVRHVERQKDRFGKVVRQVEKV